MRQILRTICLTVTLFTGFSLRTHAIQGPSVTLSSTTSEPTNASPIPVTITFSEAVTDFVVGDITITNGTASDFSGSGSTYTLNITPSGQGVITVDVAAGVAQDAANNLNLAATQLNRTFDNIVPSVSVSSTAPDPLNFTPVHVNITFSEAVTGFDLSDISVGNGTASNLQTSDNISWTADITPGMGGFSVGVNTGVTQDLAGNGNTASPYFQRTYDPVAPTVALSSASPDPTKDNPIVVNIKFSEIVWNFTLSDIVVGNGTASNLQMLDYHENWTVDITPASDGEVTVNIPAGAAQDYATNNNIAATQFSRTCDITSPTVVISSTSTNSTNSNPIPVTITFSEPVTGFDAGDITVTNGTKGTLSGSGTTYTIDISPLAQGKVTVDIAAGVATDAVGNSNTVATQFSRIYDSQAPSVSVTSPIFDPFNLSQIPININFSEAVTGFSLSDITTSNCTASNLQTTDNIHWTAVVTPIRSAGMSVQIFDGVAQDLAGNGNTAAPYFQRTYDPNPPSVTLSSTSTSSTKDKPIVVKMKFSETVVNFKASNIVVTNGTTSNLQTDYYQEDWTVDIYPTADGEVTVDIPVGAAQDYAGNNNIAAAQFSRIYDATPPTVAISSTANKVTNISPIPVNITFSEIVTGFAVDDITVTNGSLGNFSGSSTTYIADITPSGEGTVNVGIAGSVAQDAAGNSNTAATQWSIVYTTGNIISGNAGTAGVTLSYTDGTPKTVLADGSGSYYIIVPVGWSGTVTPSKTGYTFSADKVYTNVLANQTLQDYTATAVTYTISGNAGVAGVTLRYTDGIAKTAIADGSGNYTFTVSYNWSGTVSASKTGYTFSADKVYTNILSDQTLQDYIATVITDTRYVNTKPIQVIVYPTVNDGKFKLNIQSLENEKVMVKIFNLQGVTVDEFQFSKSLSSETFDVIMSQATIGMYTIEIRTNGHRTLQKIMVK